MSNTQKIKEYGVIDDRLRLDLQGIDKVGNYFLDENFLKALQQKIPHVYNFLDHNSLN